MSQRKLTIAIAIVAAFTLPIGLTSPAFAEEPAPSTTAEHGLVAEETTDIAVDAAAEEVEQEAATESGADLAADIASADAARVDLDLDLEAANAAAATSTFTGVSVGKGGSITTPGISSAAKIKKIKVSFNGPAANLNRYYYMWDSSYYGPKIAISSRNKGVKSSYVYKPSFSGASGQISPAKVSNAELRVSSYVTPGKYKVRVPVTQRTYNTSTYKWTNVTKSATNYVTVKANTKTSKSMTSLSGSARAKKTFPLTVKAPNYQSGAKVTVYYKAPGKKKYTKVSTGKLKAYNSNYSKVKINIAKKYNLGGKGGHVKVKVAGVTYAGGYTSSPGKLQKY